MYNNSADGVHCKPATHFRITSRLHRYVALSRNAQLALKLVIVASQQPNIINSSPMDCIVVRGAGGVAAYQPTTFTSLQFHMERMQRGCCCLQIQSVVWSSALLALCPVPVQLACESVNTCCVYQ